MQNGLSQEERNVGIPALALVISLLFFPWFSVSLGPFGTATLKATDAPDGWLGVIGLLAALEVVIDILCARFAPQVTIPQIGGSRSATRFIFAVAAAGCVALKFLFHIHFSLFGWGFYVTVLAAGALVFFALQANGGRTISRTL